MNKVLTMNLLLTLLSYIMFYNISILFLDSKAPFKSIALNSYFLDTLIYTISVHI